MSKSEIIVTNEKQYVELTRVTWNFQDKKQDILHCLLGVSSELGELESALKKKVGYGRELDLVNVKEELGDLLYFIFRLSDTLEIELRFESIDAFEEINVKGFTVEEFMGCCSDIRQNVQNSYAEGNSKSSIEFELLMALEKTLVLCKHFGVANIFEILTINIRKLSSRFGEKFDSYLEANRDLEAERKILGDDNTK